MSIQRCNTEINSYLTDDEDTLNVERRSRVTGQSAVTSDTALTDNAAPKMDKARLMQTARETFDLSKAVLAKSTAHSSSGAFVRPAERTYTGTNRTHLVPALSQTSFGPTTPTPTSMVASTQKPVSTPGHMQTSNHISSSQATPGAMTSQIQKSTSKPTSTSMPTPASKHFPTLRQLSTSRQMTTSMQMLASVSASMQVPASVPTQRQMQTSTSSTHSRSQSHTPTRISQERFSTPSSMWAFTTDQAKTTSSASTQPRESASSTMYTQPSDSMPTQIETPMQVDITPTQSETPTTMPVQTLSSMQTQTPPSMQTQMSASMPTHTATSTSLPAPAAGPAPVQRFVSPSTMNTLNADTGDTDDLLNTLQDVELFDFMKPRPQQQKMTRERHERMFYELERDGTSWSRLINNTTFHTSFTTVMHNRRVPNLLSGIWFQDEREPESGGFEEVCRRIRAVSAKHGVHDRCSDHQWTEQELASIVYPNA